MNKQNIIMVKPQGYCGGVLKAIKMAKQTRLENPDVQITILGNLVHNKYVKEALSFYQINTIYIDKTIVDVSILRDLKWPFYLHFFLLYGIIRK